MRFTPSLLSLLAVAAFAMSACQTTTPSAAGAKPTASVAAATAPLGTAGNIAHNCFTCHGPDGRSPGTIPSLHLLSAERIAARMKDFKSSTEPSTVMGRHAKGYTDAEIEAVAQYIASLRK